MSRPIKTFNKDFNFAWNFHNYGIRTIHEKWDDPKSPIRKDCPIELIAYNDDTHSSCYTLAYFHLDDEGYELHSVGSRLFDHINSDVISEIWSQLQAAQKMLDAYFEACKENEDYNY